MKIKKQKIISILLTLGLFFSFSGIFSIITTEKVLAVTAPYQGPTQAGFQIVPNNCGQRTDGSDQCGWSNLVQLIKNIMAFMIYVSAFLATMSFAYAGFLYLTAFGEMGKVEKAHGVFSKAMIGMVFVLLAWLIVATILSTLGVKGAFSLINFSSVPKLDLTQ